MAASRVSRASEAHHSDMLALLNTRHSVCLKVHVPSSKMDVMNQAPSLVFITSIFGLELDSLHPSSN